MWPQLQHEMVMGQLTKFTKVSITAVTCQPRETRFEKCSQCKSREIHRPTLVEFLSSKAVRQRITENQRWENAPSARGYDMSQGSATDTTMSMSQLLCPTPVSMGMHSAFKRTMQDSSCTCCPRSPAVSQNHDSPMASEVPRPVSNRPFPSSAN